VWKVIACWVCLIIGALSLTRGLHVHQQITEKLDTGALGVLRSAWVWLNAEIHAEVAWYRDAIPWMISGGVVLLIIGVFLALRLTADKKRAADKKTPRKK
jgi:membrane protein YdbS with pleckstrin-like domain